MNERTLLKLALACSILGLLLLVLISTSISPDAIPINKVDGTQQRMVKVYGTVSEVRSAGQGQVLEVSQPASIEVFVTSPIEVQRGDVVEIIGREDEYNDNPQLIAERIRVARSGQS